LSAGGGSGSVEGMSPRATLDRPAAQPESPARTGAALRVILVAAAIAAVLTLVSLVPTPSFVSRITYENRSPYDLDVEVATSPHGAWMSTGEATRSSRTDAEQVFDLGDRWWFRYSAQGRSSRPFELTRTQLERSGWTVVVPTVVARDFETRGVPPQP
jgi:hypothetical protein